MKTAVIGVGKLGKIHARIYQELADCELIAVCDMQKPNVDNLKDVPFYKNYKDLLELGVEAVSIATPTVAHHEVAKFFLENGVACLIEKPIAIDMQQANELLEIAKRKNVFMMVGMVERFNKAYDEARKIIKKPQFIESHRLGPFPNRSLDVSVVLDLMIHDLDILLDLVASPVATVEAVGVHAMSKKPDIANARISFENGCVANITASRISDERMRRTRVFFDKNYISLDFAHHKIKAYKKTMLGIDKKIMDIPVEEPLKRELLYFYKNIRQKKHDYEIAENSIAALDLAIRIDEQISKERDS